MKWNNLFSASLVLFGLVLFSCSEQPQNSETKTNWLVACESSDECGDASACICGICSAPCVDTSECDGGVCGSPIGTASHCSTTEAAGGGPGAAAPERLCLPQEETCSSVSLPVDNNLGSATPPQCDLPGALICEGFDAPLSEDTSTWNGSAEAEIQSCESQAGDGALRFSGTGDVTRQTRIRLPETVDSGLLYSRFYLNVSSGAQIADQLLFYELWHRESDVPERITLGIFPDSSLHSYIGAEDIAVGSIEGLTIEYDQWLCVEVSVIVDDAFGTLTVDVDGTRMIDVADVDTRPVDPFEVAVVQMLQHDGVEDSYADFMVDELYVGTEVIGCASAGF